MLQVKATHRVSGDDPFMLSKGLVNAKRDALADAKGYLTAAQSRGEFPKDPDDYVLFLRNRGRWSRRKWNTIRPEYLRIPFILQWVAGTEDTSQVKLAALFAYEQLLKRAPVRTGAYKSSIAIWVNSTKMSVGSFQAYELLNTDRVFVAPDIKYGAIIELGFYKKRYKTQSIPGGIVRPVARMTRNRFKNEVVARFAYINPGTYEQRYGTLPAVEIGIIGSFSPNDSRPGRPLRKRKRGT